MMKRILVIDDNIEILEIFKVLFELYGYEVYTLARGDKTLETVKLFSPDIILLDVFLAGCNGLDICHQLKSLPETKKIPVVMISAHSDQESVLNTCPAEAFVAKPFDIPYLTSIIEQQLIKTS